MTSTTKPGYALAAALGFAVAVVLLAAGGLQLLFDHGRWTTVLIGASLFPLAFGGVMVQRLRLWKQGHLR